MDKQEVNKISKMPVEVEDLKKFFEEYLENPKKEKYDLSWAGKVNAKKEALIPTSKTLSPQEDESKDWDDTENVFIEGDNLDALKLLQRKYFEKIKMIYIDPPYNTGKDFIYRDNFSRSSKEELEESGEMVDGKLLTTNAKTNGRFHSDWLNMMYSRLFLAHKLLKDDGVIFISIDDNEVANLRLLMDEIFGEENFVACLKWKRKKQPSFLANHVATVMEYILVFGKEKESLEKLSIEGTTDFTKKVINISNKESKRFFKKNVRIKIDGKGVIKAGRYKIKTMEVEYLQDVHYENGRTVNEVEVLSKFATSQDNINNYIENDLLFITANKGLRRDVSEEEIGKRKSITDLLINGWGDNQESEDEMRKIFKDNNYFDYTKPVKLIANLINSCFTEDEIILDFFAGSGTTAHAVMDLNAEDQGNRKYICVQLDEEVDEKSEAGKAGYKNIAEIARERIRRAGSSVAEAMKDKEKISENKKEESAKREKPLDIGFRSFKISNSNYRKWEAGDFDMFEEKPLEQAKLFMDKPLIDNYKEINVVFEIIVKEGFALSSKISHKNDVWEIKDNDRKMIIDFGKKINSEKVEKLNLDENDIFVCFDSALNDSDKVNLTKSINLKVV